MKYLTSPAYFTTFLLNHPPQWSGNNFPPCQGGIGWSSHRSLDFLVLIELFRLAKLLAQIQQNPVPYRMRGFCFCFFTRPFSLLISKALLKMSAFPERLERRGDRGFVFPPNRTLVLVLSGQGRLQLTLIHFLNFYPGVKIF